jgi:signal transduction histidine kinase
MSPFQATRKAGRRSLTMALSVAAAALWLAIAALVAGLLLTERKETLSRAERETGALAMVLEAHTARTFEAVDVTLAGIADTLRLAPHLETHDPQFRKALTARLLALQPYVRAIFVIAENGWIVHDTDFPATPKVSLDDRPYFQSHLQNPALVRSVSGPYASRSGLGWFLAVARRVGVGEEFQGIVVAALQAQYFEALYRKTSPGDADLISLFHRDGMLVATYPDRPESLGQSFSGLEPFSSRLASGPSGSYRTDSGPFDYARLVTYRALEEAPFVIVVIRNMATILHSWRTVSTIAAATMALLALLLTVLVAQFLRQQRLRELARERAAQTEKLEALAYLTGGISHDFANLLQVVSSSLQLISTSPSNEPRTRDAVAVAERAVLHGSHLIDRLLSFARRRPLHVHAANLNALVDLARELLVQLVGSRMEIKTELAGDLAPCLVDETEFDVALVNLLVNARDAGARRVVLKTFNCTQVTRPAGWLGQRPADYICLSVQDDGRGMSEEVRRRALEPYYTTKGMGGTGLGLPQVYGFLRQVGGDVHLESQPGKGTTVTLLFPKAPVALPVTEV